MQNFKKTEEDGRKITKDLRVGINFSILLITILFLSFFSISFSSAALPSDRGTSVDFTYRDLNLSDTTVNNSQYFDSYSVSSLRNYYEAYFDGQYYSITNPFNFYNSTNLPNLTGLTVKGYSSVWAERGSIASNNYWSMGNGQSPLGAVMGVDGTIEYFGAMCSGSVGTSVPVHVTVNGIDSSSCEVNITSGSTNFSVTCNEPFNQGDIIGIETGTVSGSWTECVGNAVYSYDVQGSILGNFNVSNNFDVGGNITATYFIGNISQATGFPITDISGLVPYTDATSNVDLGNNDLNANTFTSTNYTENQINGNFATEDFTGWTAGTNWNVVSEQASFSGTGSGALTSDFNPVVGQYYKVIYDIKSKVEVAVIFNGDIGGTSLNMDVGDNKTAIFKATTTSPFTISLSGPNFGSSIVLDNIKIISVGNSYTATGFTDTIYKGGEIESDTLFLNVDTLDYLGTFGFDILPESAYSNSIGNATSYWDNIFTRYVSASQLRTLGDSSDYIFLHSGGIYNIRNNQHILDIFDGDVRIPQDNIPLKIGAGQDASLYFDGTNPKMDYTGTFQFQEGGGDINASTVYYDTLTAKSPIILCSDNDCIVFLPKQKENYFFEKDENYNILSFSSADGKLLGESEFIRDEDGYIIEAKKIEGINKILNKTKRLNAKAICINAGNKWDGSCYNLVTSNVTRLEAVESYQAEKLNKIETTCTQLNKELIEKQVECTKEIKTGIYENQYKFKQNCEWNKLNGYQCIERLNV